jgi:hypothetical protein
MFCTHTSIRHNAYTPACGRTLPLRAQDRMGLVSATCEVTADTVSVTFVRTMSIGKDSIALDGATNIVWALGSSLGSFSKHKASQVNVNVNERRLGS